MKKNLILFALTFGLILGCSSNKKEKELVEKKHEGLKKDFVVRDASSNTRPGWVEDAELWAKEYGKDTSKYRYFSYETEPKVGRSIACNLAKANAKVDIAGEIATFIDKQLASSTEGRAGIDENNPQVQGLREFVSNTLAEKIQALIHGAAVVKTYWEKRNYQVDLGAKRDFSAFTCAVFIRIPSKRLSAAVNEAANHVVKKADDPETKANVKQALKDASKNFVKAKQGTI